MARHRNRDSRTYEEEDKQDIRRQEGIFLCTLFLMVLLLVSLYFQLSVLAIAIVTAALIFSTIGFYIHFKDFFSMRDRGQRTVSVLISLYGSLILTLICAWYYVQDEPLTLDYALVFLFGFFFFTFMVYRSISRYLVVGNKRQRIKG